MDHGLDTAPVDKAAGDTFANYKVKTVHTDYGKRRKLLTYGTHELMDRIKRDHPRSFPRGVYDWDIVFDLACGIVKYMNRRSITGICLVGNSCAAFAPMFEHFGKTVVFVPRTGANSMGGEYATEEEDAAFYQKVTSELKGAVNDYIWVDFSTLSCSSGLHQLATLLGILPKNLVAIGRMDMTMYFSGIQFNLPDKMFKFTNSEHRIVPEYPPDNWTESPKWGELTAIVGHIFTECRAYMEKKEMSRTHKRWRENEYRW